MKSENPKYVASFRCSYSPFDKYILRTHCVRINGPHPRGPNLPRHNCNGNRYRNER